MPLPVEWRRTSGPFGPFGPYPSDFGPYPTLPYPTLTLGVRGFHPGENYCIARPRLVAACKSHRHVRH